MNALKKEAFRHFGIGGGTILAKGRGVEGGFIGFSLGKKTIQQEKRQEYRKKGKELLFRRRAFGVQKKKTEGGKIGKQLTVSQVSKN